VNVKKEGKHGPSKKKKEKTAFGGGSCFHTIRCWRFGGRGKLEGGERKRKQRGSLEKRNIVKIEGKRPSPEFKDPLILQWGKKNIWVLKGRITRNKGAFS